MTESRSSAPIAAITGANGYVGSIVNDALTTSGFQIRKLVRRPEQDSDDHFYDIATGCSPDALKGADLLVHCAYDFSAVSRAAIWNTNVYGTRSLLDLAVSCGVRRTIVVSSMSAYAGTRQLYGRAKLASEIDALAHGMCVVRPGLVYGPGWGGMGGTLRKLVALPLVPLVGSEAHQFTLHEDDLRGAFAALAQAEAIPSQPLGLAHPDPVSFKYLLTAIRRFDSDRNPRFVPIPWLPLYWAIRAIELARVELPIRADSLLGLVRPAPSVPNVEEWRALGVNVRPFSL